MASLADPGKLHDLKVCNPIPHRKVLVMINTFVVTTTRFLNRFANLCDDKLSDVSSDIAKLQTTISILEAKLSSVPDLAAAATAADTSAIPDVAQPAAATAPAAVSSSSATSTSTSPPVATPILPTGPPAKEDPTYLAYFKLIRLGMPLEQVKLKCSAEGNDPNVLDHPDEPITAAMLALPAPAAAGNNTDYQESSSTALVAAGNDEVSNELVVTEEPVEDLNVMKVKDDPEFSKYFKMLLVGIPNPVVKHKMTMDGLDPDVLNMKPTDPSPNA